MTSGTGGPGQAAGVLLAIGALVVIIGFVLHGDDETLPGIADGAAMWRLSHNLIGAGALVVAASALCALAARGRTSSTAAGALATALVVVSAMAVGIAAFAETGRATAAEAGEDAAFDTLSWGFDPVFNAFPGLYLGLAMLGLIEARSGAPRVPRWASWIGGAAFTIGTLSALVLLLAGTNPALETGAFGVPLLGFVWAAWFGLKVAQTAGRMPAA